MPRSCPPLRPDRVGWHGCRVRTRLRLILERVFWFVNGGMSLVMAEARGAASDIVNALPHSSPRSPQKASAYSAVENAAGIKV